MKYKTVNITEDVRIPSSNIILEKGDKILFNASEKVDLDISYFLHSIYSKYIAREEKAKIPGTNIEVLGGDKFFFSNEPEHNEYILELANEFKGWKVGNTLLKPVVKYTVLKSDLDISGISPYPFRYVDKGCVIGVITPKDRISVKKVTQLNIKRGGKTLKEGPVDLFLYRDSVYAFEQCKTIPEIEAHFRKFTLTKPDFRDMEKWKLSGKELTTNFEPDEYREGKVALRFYL